MPSESLADLDIDPSRPGFFLRPDYHDVLTRLRAEAPVYELEPGVRYVTRYHDVRGISRDPERFCSGRGVLINDPLRQGGVIEGSILHMDPPAHRSWRQLLNRQFTPRAVARLEEPIRARAVALLDAVRGEDVDLVDAFCAPLPVAVICELLGVPEADRKDFRRWSDATILATDGTAELPEDAVVSVMELLGYLDALAKERATNPGDDLLSVLAGAEVDGTPLQGGEIVTFAMSLLVAGNETTRHLVSGGVLALDEHPDQRDALAVDPVRIPTAVEECLRWVTPIQQFARTATAATEIGGVQVDEGDYLVMSYASANRDETVFGSTAATFDVTRAVETPNLAFGFGEHLCLGAALARLEARVVFEELYTAGRHVEITGAAEWVASSLVRGPHVLPARVS